MADPIGFINAGNVSGIAPQTRPPGSSGGAGATDPNAPSFKDVLMENLTKVSELQQDASTAAEDLATGRRNDLETVLMATAKADTAFRMLLAVRNKMMDAYEEIKQIRV